MQKSPQFLVGELGKIGEVLWGICVDDMTCRFSAGDYVSTSRITDFNSHTKLVKTTSGSLYQTLGEGKQASINFHDFELLRQGFSPEQISMFNGLSIGKVH
ncbi:hypothetical protein KUL42_22740 [Alteromonas sp. KUL42]|uniref:hypothetical protein n=1 Tax=Alteromonas sp. KUL42 TaxID=2480797 RepID=UPI0010364E5D|nr:hypothetical protein [Alteromonas sp. KUL42]TAP34769.1 hypothetical protein EYR97_11210 [Alteromonas sp. KUL42]GEA07513.1 hypothetical protein KUL42_22740 [Alteromonas sp. KUL42]